MTPERDFLISHLQERNVAKVDGIMKTEKLCERGYSQRISYFNGKFVGLE